MKVNYNDASKVPGLVSTVKRSTVRGNGRKRGPQSECRFGKSKWD
ncbi:MAG: hypothetical protein ACRD4W_06585 [Nitrososphaeraceae archaeon]